MVPPLQPKMASNWATVAPAFAGRVAAIFRTPCADPRTPAAVQAFLKRLPKEYFGQRAPTFTSNESQVSARSSIQCFG